MSNPAKVWKWLSKYKASQPLTALKHPQIGDLLNGSEVQRHLKEYWQNIWPQTPSQQQHEEMEELESSAPWPRHPAPALAPITLDEFRLAANSHKKKSPGLDSWSAAELYHLPDEALQTTCKQYDLIESGQSNWPQQLLQWKQCHQQKQSKPQGELDSTRPISIGSIFYRIWASSWIKANMPPEQHGSLKGRSTMTALVKPLTLLERGKQRRQQQKQQQQNQHHNHRRHFTYIGASDLSKAFDRMHAEWSIRALSRMGCPNTILERLRKAWAG